MNVQIDAIGVAMGNAAAPFLPVFLAHLGSSTFQIGLLTAMPAITGLLLAIPLGNMLQGQRQIVPWFSGARLVVILSYALTGLAAIFVPPASLVNVILLIWALATIPQTIVGIGFSVVMNAVAGPNGRYELMSRRWSLLGLSTSITVFAIGQVLGRVIYPLNYQIVFLGLSAGGLISFYFSSHIKIPDNKVRFEASVKKIGESLSALFKQVKREKAFLSFIGKRFVFLSGVTMAVPLFPIYFVRVINASDSWIATITTVQTAIMVVGYFVWSQQSRRHGARLVLLWTTLGLSIYPILTAFSILPWQISIYAGLAGIFQAGNDLVFFDELLSTFPAEYSATFVGVAQSVQYFSTIFSPLVGSALADSIGVGPALIVAGLLRLAGFGLFAIGRAGSVGEEKAIPKMQEIDEK
ncbi:MAG TPA: MFS transporter [Anaerolineaceae bacterium]|nr:MFS transporter [Anaerolineaceae bacterium]